jgi:hypothetical protein
VPASQQPSTSDRARRGPSLPALLALAVAAVLIVVLLVVPMVHAVREPRAEVLDTNAKLDVSQSAEVLQPGERACVRGLDVPLRRVDVRVFPGFLVKQAPTLQLTVQDRAGAVLYRTTAKGYGNGLPLAVPVDVGRPRREVRVCVRDAGPDGVTLAHAVLPQQGRVHLPIRVDISTRPFRTIDRIPVALTRASFFKSDVVSRPLIAALFVLVLALVAAVVVLLLRARSDEDADA